MSNMFDDIQIDIDAAHEQINNNLIECSNIENYISIKHKILNEKKYIKYVDAGLIRGWFEEYSEYWSRALLGRPLTFHTFFYLYSHYRTKFQAVEVKDQPNREEFLSAWQKYENIYLTFHNAYKIAANPYMYRKHKVYLNKKGVNVLEYYLLHN